MKLQGIHFKLAGARRGKTAFLAGFLILFSLGMGTAIYLKLQAVATMVSVISVIIWQLAIWMPLIFTVCLFRFILLKARVHQDKTQWIYLGVTAILVIALHFLWFYTISLQLSPYLGLPKTRYGVYPFFFIFWIMIDILLISGLLIYLKYSEPKKTGTTGGKAPNSFYIKKGNKGYLLKPDEIFWIAAEDYYVRLFTSHGRFLERKSLKSVLMLLPEDQFIRIHRSTVVIIKAIIAFKSISSQKAELSLKGGHSRFVSRTYLKSVKEILKNSDFKN